MTPTDAEIIRASRRRPELFEEIYRRHVDAVYRFAVGRVGVLEAEDVVADTFVRALSLRHRYRHDRPNALPWLFGVAANIVRERRRRAARAHRAHRRLAGRRHVEVDTLEQIPERLDAESMSDALAEALTSLSDVEYRTLMLVTVGGLTYQETADELGVPIGTVRSRTARARAKLGEQLGTERPISPG